MEVREPAELLSEECVPEECFADGSSKVMGLPGKFGLQRGESQYFDVSGLDLMFIFILMLIFLYFERFPGEFFVSDIPFLLSLFGPLILWGGLTSV